MIENLGWSFNLQTTILYFFAGYGFFSLIRWCEEWVSNNG